MFQNLDLGLLLAKSQEATAIAGKILGHPQGRLPWGIVINHPQGQDLSNPFVLVFCLVGLLGQFDGTYAAHVSDPAGRLGLPPHMDRPPWPDRPDRPPSLILRGLRSDR